MAAKTGKRCMSAMVAVLVPFAGTIILYCVPRSNVGGSLAGLYILFCYWGPYIVVQTMMVSSAAACQLSGADFNPVCSTPTQPVTPKRPLSTVSRTSATVSVTS